MKAYIAGPFFNDEQTKRVELVKLSLQLVKISYYSPKDDCLYTPENDMTSEEVFEENAYQIKHCDFMVAITDDKDVGTMFEAGYAYANGVPICYIWFEHNDMKFNIMLAESASYVAYDVKQLRQGITKFCRTNAWPNYTLKGELE